MPTGQSNSPPSDLINRPKTSLNLSMERVVYWSVTLIVATVYLAASMPKLGGFGFFDERFELWGYPHWFEVLIGVIEATAAIFLIIPATALYSAGVLMLIMLGAVVTHLAFGHALLAIVPILMLGVLGYIGWMNRPANVRRLAGRHEIMP